MWGIRQPPIDEIRESALDTGELLFCCDVTAAFKLLLQCASCSSGLDVVIMPGCAFTADGKRLGHGKGYYDRFLARYKETFGEFPYLIGVGFKEQIVDDLPVTELDVIINEVITTD